MATSYGPYGVMNFSGIGDLPNVYREAQVYKNRQSLADLDPNDYTSLEQRAKLIMPTEPELGLKLMGTAQALRKQDAERKAYREAIGADLPPVGPPRDPRNLVPFIRSEAERLNIDPDVAVRVAMSEGLSNPIGDSGKSFGAFQLYTGGGMGNDFARDMKLNPADPANERATITYALERAAKEGWGAFHGAKNTGISPYQGIGGTRVAQAAPGTVTDAGRTLVGAPPDLNSTTAAEARRIRIQLMNPDLDDKTRAPLMEQFKQKLKEMEPTAAQKEMDQFNATQRIRGLPQVDMPGFEAAKKFATEDVGAGLKQYYETTKPIYDEGRKGRNVHQILTSMETLMTDPNFVSGLPGQEQYLQKGMNNIVGIAHVLGIPMTHADGSDNIFGKLAKTTATTENFNALAKRLVFETAGTLGNQISEGDREFIKKMYNSLDQSPEANRAMIFVLKRVAERKMLLSKMTTDEHNRGNRNAGNLEDKLNDFVQNKNNNLFTRDELYKATGFDPDKQQGKTVEKKTEIPKREFYDKTTGNPAGYIDPDTGQPVYYGRKGL